MSARAFYDPIGAGGVTLIPGAGPVLGDPEPVVRLAATQYLTTGDLESGDSGDAGNLYAMAVEFWFQTDTVTPAGGDLIMQGPTGVSDGVNRQWKFTLGADGRVSFTVRSESLTTSTVTAPAGQALQPNTWYHIVGAIYGAPSPSQQLYINGVGVAGSIFWNDRIREGLGAAGTADMVLGDVTGVSVFTFSNIAFYRQALSAARVSAHYVAATQRGFPQQVTHSRVNDVLDAVDSTAPRHLRTGFDVMTPRYMTGQTPLDAIREAVVADNIDAAFFVGADGALVFLDEHAHLASGTPYSISQAVFDDLSATGPYYVDLTIDYSDSFIANEISVTREGTSQAAGVTQTVSDAASISRYGKRSQSLTGLPIVDDATALGIAGFLLAKYKDPMLRITAMTLSTADPEAAQAALKLDLGYKITVKRQPPGGGAQITEDLWIQKIEVSGANDGQPWTIRLGVSPV
jgi:hypothetical protein